MTAQELVRRVAEAPSFLLPVVREDCRRWLADNPTDVRLLDVLADAVQLLREGQAYSLDIRLQREWAKRCEAVAAHLAPVQELLDEQPAAVGQGTLL